jgi:8-oxo-dGTP pyrophosphatase MutT (NUDIX family)
MAAPGRISDPRAIPVRGNDAHLSPIAIDRMAPAALRRRFAAPPPWSTEFSGDGRLFNQERAPAQAAVLVPLVQRESGLQVLLTQRTDHLHDHAGQISFPGGRSEADDADATATALREAAEEIGLDARHVDVIGQLPTYTTITNFVVTPVVALVEPSFELVLDAFEVAEAFEVPLAHLMTPAHHQRHAIVIAGQERQFLSMPWRTAQADGGEREFFIWGATAAMLRNLYRFLAA